MLSTFTLGVGGTETYVLTVAEQLQRLGHQVTVHAMEVDDSANTAADSGIRVVRGERNLPETCDAVLAQDSIVSLFHARRYPRTPQVFVCHSDYFDFQLPPQVPEVAQVVVALNDRVARRVAALALDEEIVRLRQPVDIVRFAPKAALNERPRRLLVLSAYAQHDRQSVVEQACAELGIECRRIGVMTATNTRTELAMADCDIVVGKERVIVEAMAAGRAAYVWDVNGGDGWVSPDRYDLLEADNFGGQAEPWVVDADRLRRDLAAYDPAMGTANRDLAVRNHSAGQHAEALVELVQRHGAPRDRPQAPLRELERLARSMRFMETRSFHLVRENDALRVRLAEVDPEFVPATARHDSAGDRLRHLRALGHESVRDRVRWHAWRLRARRRRSTARDLAAENEVLRRRLELVALERDEHARTAAADGALTHDS